ncbi:hypothetical protein BU24DRAFT_450086 [Aaosphaeria arxii CBS 175.79]|uniref:Rhodopsin domain-containing protein n=1 Tax=Aaosphaeria arxii CBS 175.79 TaxID=1450172 RepID=A0A6A5XR90_9PLEO|nr:uncharacterized protein BU24DRAFT_450086 [Aaosphaeria arxii CBS 175.79]KAF2015347.1 hypothetical protein BU24DRAFT_450086 [Aaosphaeria arxii CBS 175.79]
MALSCVIAVPTFRKTLKYPNSHLSPFAQHESNRDPTRAAQAVKLSILAFYHNLFIASETFKKAVYATATLCIVWLIVATVIVLVQCRPINAFWDLSIASPSSPMVCYPSATVILGYEISNLLIDVIILLLPVVMVCRLRLPTWRKVLVAAIFLQGGFIVRITRVWRPPNTAINIHLPTALLWTNIQYGAAVICACLPTYGPLLKSGPVSRVAKRILNSCRREKRNHVSFHSWLKPGSGHDTSSVSKDVHDQRLRYDIESCNDEYSCKTIGDGQSDIARSRMSLSDDLAGKAIN